MAVASPEVTEKFKQILNDNGIAFKVKEILLKDSGLKGENMGSSTEYVEVIFEGEKKPLHLFTKRETVNEQMNKLFKEWQLFDKESEFFMRYLKRAEEFCEKVAKPELMEIYPKCYYGDEKLIVFENLVVGKEYVLLDKEAQQDFESAKLALINLAKHHAISYALIGDYGDPGAFFGEHTKLIFESMIKETTRSMMQPVYDNALDTNVKIIEKSNIEGGEKVVELMKSIKGIGFNEQLKCADTVLVDDSQFNVLNHGDYWNNNMLFLKEEGQMKRQIMIDFQVTRYGSPCLDLSYFLFTSVKPEVRRSRLEELFQVYLEALNGTLSDLTYPVNYNMEQLKKDYLKHFEMGWWQALNMVTGAGYAVFTEFDINEETSVEDFGEKWNEMVWKYLDNHPDLCLERAEIILGYVNEYEKLKSGVVF